MPIRVGKRRRVLFTIALVFIALLLIEATAYVAIALAPESLRREILSMSERHEKLAATISTMLERRPDALALFDSHLGWKPRANLDNGTDIINGQALRSAREYSPRADAGTLRVAVFGDSFVYGSEVAGERAWPFRLEQSRQDLEILNYGVPGYGPDQAYLRFLSAGDALAPDVVVLGIATPGLSRILTVSAVFRNPSPDFIAKPRFVLDDAGALELIPNPLRRLEDARRYRDDPAAIRELGEFDYWYEPWVYENAVFESSHAVRLVVALGSKVWRRYLDGDRPLAGPPGRGVFNRASGAFVILSRILDAFVVEVRARQARPLVVILPDGYSLELSRQGHPGIMAPVRDYCEEKGIPFIDLTEAFLAEPESVPLDRWFVHRFHYTAEGNEIVARWLAEWIGSVEEPVPDHQRGEAPS